MRDGFFAGRKLLLLLSAGTLVLAVLFLGIVAFLEREVVYTHEEVASGLVIHETEDGFWLEAALYPETGFAVSNETISVDEENNVRYLSLYVYLSTKAKNLYFEEVSPTPFLAVWDHGYGWGTISDYDFDGQGNFVKPEATGDYGEYRVVRRVYYAHFERHYDRLIFHTEPILIWSDDTE